MTGQSGSYPRELFRCNGVCFRGFDPNSRLTVYLDRNVRAPKKLARKFVLFSVAGFADNEKSFPDRSVHYSSVWLEAAHVSPSAPYSAAGMLKLTSCSINREAKTVMLQRVLAEHVIAVLDGTL